jgi:hypothetical protein
MHGKDNFFKKNWSQNLKRRDHLGRPRHRWVDGIKLNVDGKGMDWIY